VIKGLKTEGRNARDLLEKEFEIKNGMKKIQVVGKIGIEVVIVEMGTERKDNERKKEVRKIFIDHDMTQKEKEMQRKLRECARKERLEGRKVKVGYRKIKIQGNRCVEVRKKKGS